MRSTAKNTEEKDSTRFVIPVSNSPIGLKKVTFMHHDLESRAVRVGGDRNLA